MSGKKIPKETRQRLEYKGYEIRKPNGYYLVSRIEWPEKTLRFNTWDDLDQFIDLLDRNTEWLLDLNRGNVDVDRDTGIVTPRDGSEPFHTNVADGWGGLHSIEDHDTRSNYADYLQIKSVERPTYGGAWYTPGLYRNRI